MSDDIESIEPDYTIKPEIFTVGAEGEKGQRVFFFQCKAGEQTLSLKCEKSHVVALFNIFTIITENNSVEYDIAPDELEPEPPDVESLSWVLGNLKINFAEKYNDIEMLLTRVVSDEGENPDWVAKLKTYHDEEINKEFIEEEVETIHLIVSVEQAGAFLKVAERLLEEGRPLCKFCAAPLNNTPESDFCHCWN